MTVVKSLHGGEVIPLPRSELVRVDPGAAIGAPPAPSNSNDLPNVIPFMRPHAAEAPAVVLPGDVAPRVVTSLARERVRLAGFAALSLLVHGALFTAFWREPEPLASIGVEVISAEIIIGATAPAGAAPAPGEADVQAPAAPDPQPTEQQAETEQKATVQPQSVEVAREETAPAVKTEEPKAQEPEAEQQTAAEPPQPSEEKPAVALLESPQPDRPPEPKIEPEPKVEARPVPRPVTAPPRPVKDAAPARERHRIEAPTRERAVTQAKASTPSTAANGVGVGRSDLNSNYPGIVSAHLRRHQQYPSDARSRGEQGTATVSFSLDGGGRVTSSRLVRGSGVASIDSEVQAMVRRASPFPEPPGGAPRSFTVPVSFRLN